MGEVAGKLRLLAIEKGSNTPLLVRLMTECQVQDVAVVLESVPPNLSGPQAGDSVTLAEFLALPRLALALTNGQRKTMTAQELVELVAEKHGAAHEDWAHPEQLTLIRQHPAPSMAIRRWLALWRPRRTRSWRSRTRSCFS